MSAVRGFVATAAFCGCLVGLLAPAFFFGQRLATLEERSARNADSLNEVKEQLRTVIELLASRPLKVK